MFPASITDNFADMARRDLEAFGDNWLAHPLLIQATNFYHVWFCEFGIGASLAAKVSVTTLLISINNIFLLGAEKQMVRVATRWIVTTMKHAYAMMTLAFWYGAIGQFPREPVRRIALAVVDKMTIPLVAAASLPLPTLIWFAFGAATPEVIFRRCAQTPIVTAKKLHRLAFYPTVLRRISTRQLSRLATAAHAQTAWVRLIQYMSICSRIMTGYIAYGQASNVFGFLVSLFGNRGKLSTATLTVAVRNLCCWIMGCACEKRELWSMLCHVNSPFTTLTTPRDACKHRRGNFIGLLPEYFSTNRLEMEVAQ